MRSSVAVRVSDAASKRRAVREPLTNLISLFLAAVLAVGLLPAQALAAPSSLTLVPEGDEGAVRIAPSVEEGSETFSHCLSDDASFADADGAASLSEDVNDTDATRIADGVINQQVNIEPIAQAESSRSFFLVQTLESTKVVPMVSANLSFEDTEVVVGSFECDGMVFAVEPGGESASLIAVSYEKLPRECIEKQVLVIPEMVTSDGVDSYNVTRIADGALSSLTKEVSDPTYVGAASFLPEGDALEDCTGIVALSIPSSVSSIEEGAFAGSDTLQHIVISDDNRAYASYDGLLYDVELTSLLFVPEGRVGAVRIASSVEAIDPEVFSHCPLVDSIISAPDCAAFSSADGCLYSKDMSTLLRVPAGVSEATLVAGCVTIGAKAFAGCATLSSIIVHGSISDIADDAFVVSNRVEKGRSDDKSSSDGMKVFLATEEASSCAALWTSKGFSTTSVDPSSLDESNVEITSSSAYAASGSVTAYGNGGTLKTQRHDTGAVLASGQTSRTMSGSGVVYKAGHFHIWTNSTYYDVVTPEPRLGYTFLGWSTSSSGSPITSDVQISPSGTYRFYAIWRPDIVAVGNGGTLTTRRHDTGAVLASKQSSRTMTGKGEISGQWFNVWTNNTYYEVVQPDSRLGYTWRGWSANPTGSPVTSVKLNANTSYVYYAIWSVNTYSITYKDNGGTFTGKTSSYNVNSNNFSLPSAGTRTGYTFAGWDVSGASGAGITGNGTKSVTIKKGTAGNLTATAKWTPVNYSISWDPSGGTLSGQKTTYNIETADYVLPAPTRTGYTFAGWDVTGASGAGVTGNGTTNVTVKRGTYGNLAAKAKWTLNTYHLSWNVSHGSHVNRTEDFTVEDCPIAMGAATPDTGYAFAGWSGPGLAGSPSTFLLESSFLAGKGNGTTFSYVASMTANPYTIRLHANDGTSTLVEHAVTYDAAVSSVSIPKRYGYAFSGYYVKEGDGTKGERVFDGHGSYLADSGIWKRTCDMDLYASWTIMGSLEVPLCDPSSLSFALDRATGEAMASPEGGSEAKGHLRSTMPEEVPLASVELESLTDPTGTLIMERAVGAENLDRCSMKLLFPSSSSDIRLRFARPGSPDISWEFDPDSAPCIPAAVSASPGTSGDGVVQDELGNLAQEGELELSYALALDAGFDVTKMPLANVSETVARLMFTVDLTGVVQERF